MAISGEERRASIVKLLRNSQQPVSGSRLADLHGVSRQVIVQDLALIRAGDIRVLSTCRGYQIDWPKGFRGVFPVWHDDDGIRQELYAIVDAGGKVLDVMIEHGTYGRLRADLNLISRHEVDDFINRLEAGRAMPLTNLTGGYHFHTVIAESPAALDTVADNLRRLGFLRGDWLSE